MSSKKLIIVDKDSAGTRLDKFLKEQLAVPFSLIQREIRKKNIKVNKKKSSSNYRLVEADQIIVFKEYTADTDKNIASTVPENLKSKIKKSIVFRNKNFIVINKWSGIACQRGSKINISIDDLIKFLASGKDTPKLVHRLDKDTSGLLIVALNLNAARFFHKLLSTKKITKTYFAIVKNKPKKNKGIFLDNLYQERKYSNILTVNRKLYQNFNNITSNCKSWWFKCITGSFNIIDRDTTLVSYYEDSDYYKSHWDSCIVTTLTWIYKEPKVFTGGDLIFNSENISPSNFQHPLNLMGSPEKIEVKNNRMVVFPSMVPHQVIPIKMDSNYKNKGMGRFCITNFLNTNPLR